MKNIKYILQLLLVAGFFSSLYGQRQIYAVIVGVSDYKYDQYKLDLNYCDDDADLFYKLLLSSGVSAGNMVVLKDYKASRSNIVASMNTIFSKAKQSDEVIFYFSGHGSEGYFLPYDFNISSNILYHNDVKAAFKRCAASKKICIADACFSGSIKAKSAVKAPANQNKALTQNSTGEIAVMMSSRNNQTSLELSSIGQGAFTYYLVQGLKGEADKDRNKTITISEMYYYTRKAVMDKTQSKQTPIIFGKFDKDMPVLYIR